MSIANQAVEACRTKALVAFPIFAEQPSEQYLLRWRQHIDITGYPETFENVSTTKPDQLENIVLLSEEISVPVAKREGGEMIPCPFCSRDSPKFKRGRMAWFPDEKTTRFIGPRCAQTHFGENYRFAERMFARQDKCRQYLRLWKELGDHRSDLADLVDTILTASGDAQYLRDRIEEDAPGFGEFLHRELAQTKGALKVLEDLGGKDRLGNAVMQERVIGTASGLLFLAEGAQAHRAAKRAKMVMSFLENPLPAWEPSTPEHPATEEVLRVGRAVSKALKELPRVRDTLKDAQDFIEAKNIANIHRWGRNPQSGFGSFEMRRDGKQLFIRATTFAGRFYANVLLPKKLSEPIPANDHPMLTLITGMAV
jgi:hypothetical protein